MARPSVAPTCLDLFAGCGGLSEGLLRSGVDVIASVELHPQPALTHAFNHPSTSVFVGDVRKWSFDLIDEELVRRDIDALDIVVGGPPCQGFSSAGKKQYSDPRNSLFNAYINILARYRPRVFLLENVPGFRTMYRGAIHREAHDAFHQLGYQTSEAVQVAAALGVPQTRRRFVMVGWLAGEAKPFEFPTASESAPVSAYSALADLDFLRPGYEATRYTARNQIPDFARQRRGDSEYLFNHLATKHRERASKMMQQIGEGRSIRDVDPALRSAKRTMSRLDRQKLANTVLSLPDDMIHYKQDRILTVREAARLQTFDDDFVFFGKRTSGFVERRVDVPQYTQVGNAVPPIMGYELGRQIRKSLGDESAPIDRREHCVRRQRQLLVRGSSAYAGYVLDPAAKDQIELRTVTGEQLPLPINNADSAIADQRALRDWTLSSNPGRGQWAPGVVAGEYPSWQVAGEPSAS